MFLLNIVFIFIHFFRKQKKFKMECEVRYLKTAHHADRTMTVVWTDVWLKKLSNQSTLGLMNAVHGQFMVKCHFPQKWKCCFSNKCSVAKLLVLNGFLDLLYIVYEYVNWNTSYHQCLLLNGKWAERDTVRSVPLGSGWQMECLDLECWECQIPADYPTHTHQHFRSATSVLCITP